jgi:hypothetical protein
LIPQVFSFVNPNGGDIIFLSCETAKGEDHLVKSVSKSVPGCNVYGSPDSTYGMDPIFYPLSHSKKSKCLPSFGGARVGVRSRTRCYVAGREVVNSNNVGVLRQKMTQRHELKAAL